MRFPPLLSKSHFWKIAGTNLVVGNLILWIFCAWFGGAGSGLFYFDLPVGLALAFLFHDIVRGPLVRSLPLFLESRFARAKDFRWNAYFKKRWFVVCVSVLVGAFSHILWDKFTHAGGFLPWPYYKIGQYASGVIGLLVIGLFVLRKPRDSSYTGRLNLKVKLSYWSIVSIVAIFVLALRLSFGWTPSVAIASTITAGLVGVVVAGVAFRMFEK